MTEINLEKSRSGVYKDTAENRRLHRVGQRYGEPKKEEPVSRRRSYIDNDRKGGVYIYGVRKDGSRSAKPEFHKFYGDEKTAEDVIARLERLNPGKKFVAGDATSNKAEGSKGASFLPAKEDLESSKDGSSIVVENVQTGNVAIFYSKRGGKWFSRNTLTRGEIETNPEQMFRTLQGYNRKTYSIKPDLNVEERVSDIQGLKRDKKEAEDALKRLRKTKFLYDAYKGGDEKYKRAVQSLQNKIDTLGQEIARRNAESKKPNKVKIEGKKNEPDVKEETKNAAEKTDETLKQGGEESFTRVNLPDIPNAHKVNLKKYLSAKRKAAVDEAWDKAGFDNVSREKAGTFQESYNKLRENFNKNFDSMSKSERAEQLYRILKVKNAMERGINNSKNLMPEVLTPNNPLSKYIDTTKIPRPRPGVRYVVKEGQPPRTLVKVLDYHSGMGGYGVTVEYRGDGDEETGTETIDRDIFTRIFYNYKKLGDKK